MKPLRNFFNNESGGPAAEFALVLPLALIFLFGIIDAGRFMWEVNRAEKATQTGARWAAATDIIADDLVDYSFAVDGGILQGEPIDATAFPGVSCSGTSSSVTCLCATGGTCGFDVTVTNYPAFQSLVGRMNSIKADIAADNVLIKYGFSGLGYAGDPNGPDVAPVVTVSLANMTFRPITTQIFNLSTPMPDFSYSLTMEDGAGTVSN